MSETPKQQLSELTATLVHAVRLGCGFLHENDPLRRKLVDTLLTAQMRDPAAVARLQEWLTQDPTPDEINPPGVPLTDPDRLDRLRLVPKVILPMRDESPRPAEVTGHGDADLAAAAATAAGGGGQISTDPARINVRPFLAAANVVHARTLRHPPTPSGFAKVIDQARDAVTCGHPWHQMVLAGVDPFHTYCPAGCGATVQTSTIATDVDDCGHPWHSSSRPDGEPYEPSCPACGDAASPTSPIGGDGMQHKGHYAVTDTPGPIYDQVKGGDMTAPVPPGIDPAPMMAETDGDTRDWSGAHTTDCYDRDCSGCAAG